MSLRRQRAARKRAMNYLSPSQRRQKRIGVISTVISVIIGIAALVFVVIFSRDYEKPSNSRNEAIASVIEDSTAESLENEEENEEEEKRRQEAFEAYVHTIEPGFEFAHFTSQPTLKKTGDKILDRANVLYAGYDYDGAIALIKSVTGYGNIPEYKAKLEEIYETKAGIQPFKINNNITHIFYHSLIVNPAITFDPEITSFKLNDYNEAMTTVYEFVQMMEAMYAKGYVLVDIYDVAKMEVQNDGSSKMKYQQILLPDGKIPFILSIDDTNYYEYMKGQGFSQHLLIDAEGKVTNDYVLSNGETIYGSFDVITILEDFITLHPDFSYKGARGISAITGYNGVLGYRTSDFWYTEGCSYYQKTEANDKYFKTEILSGYNENIEADKKTATLVADAIKAMGWRFSSHTWGHKRLGEIPMETMVWDSDMWEREVRPIIGDTDILIFPYGNDFGQTVGWKNYEYEGPNMRYRTMKSYGFNYFLNVDGSQYFMQRSDGYFRQGRRNLDGSRLWEAVNAYNGVKGYKNRTADLFDDPTKIIDPMRPELKKK